MPCRSAVGVVVAKDTLRNPCIVPEPALRVHCVCIAQPKTAEQFRRHYIWTVFFDTLDVCVGKAMTARKAHLAAMDRANVAKNLPGGKIPPDALATGPCEEDLRRAWQESEKVPCLRPLVSVLGVL